MELNIREAEPIRVLLVEDELLISEWMAESLSEQGFAVQTATNAADALRHLASDQVDVLFTDINLPGGMDGAALARRARVSTTRRRSRRQRTRRRTPPTPACARQPCPSGPQRSERTSAPRPVAPKRAGGRPRASWRIP